VPVEYSAIFEAPVAELPAEISLIPSLIQSIALLYKFLKNAALSPLGGG